MYTMISDMIRYDCIVCLCLYKAIITATESIAKLQKIKGGRAVLPCAALLLLETACLLRGRLCITLHFLLDPYYPEKAKLGPPQTTFVSVCGGED